MGTKQSLITTLFLLILLPLVVARHVINFRSPNLHPECLSWDPTAQHFVVGSLRNPTLLSISDAGVTNTLINDQTVSLNASIVGLNIDFKRNRLLAAIHHDRFSALAAYDLKPPNNRLFLAYLNREFPSPIPNDVAVDYDGNVYVTDFAAAAVWRVSPDGSRAEIFSKSPAFSAGDLGLNGVVFNSKGYLLVIQSNIGKMFKVNVDNGSARTVILNKDLKGAESIALRRDGVVVVVSQHKAYFIKSDDSWGEGVVFDETALEGHRGNPTSVAVGAEDRVYVLYGHADEGMKGNSEREEFSIVEIGSEKESKDDVVWVYVLVGFGFAYFCVWRFQMRKLYANMNKKTA